MLNPVDLNRAKESLPDRAVSPQQKVNFNSLLLEFKLKQIDALSGLLSSEREVQSDSMAGYQRLLLDSLAGQRPVSERVDVNPQVILKKYQAVSAGSADSAPKGETTVRDLMVSAAQKHGIPEPWFEKLIRQESGFDPSAASPKGAMGLGQLMPTTAKELGLRVAADQEEGSVWNPASNLDASARYLRQLYDRYAGMGIETDEAWKFAAGAYNAGMGNIQKAMDKLDDDTPLVWEEVAGVLPQVTGQASRETLSYVENLHT